MKVSKTFSLAFSLLLILYLGGCSYPPVTPEPTPTPPPPPVSANWQLYVTGMLVGDAAAPVVEQLALPEPAAGWQWLILKLTLENISPTWLALPAGGISSGLRDSEGNEMAILVVIMMIILLGANCNSPVASPIVETASTTPALRLLASATPVPPTLTPAPPQPIATPTPRSPASTVSPPTFTPSPLSCDTHTAVVELSASATMLQVGEVVTISVTLRNQGCSHLGLPQYRLETTPPILYPARPEAVVHYLSVGPGQADTAEFGLRAGETGQVTLTVSASFEVHLGYPGPAYWAMSSAAAPLVITVSPSAQPGPEPAPPANQLDLNGALIRAWAWSPDGQTLALAGDRSVYLYNLAAPQTPTELQVAATDGVEGVAFSPDSRLLAVSIASGALQLWDISQQALIFVLDDDPRVDYFNSLAFSPDGTWLAAGGVNSRATSSSDGITKIIDLNTHREAVSFEWARWVTQVIFSPDGTLLGVTTSGTCGRGGGGVAFYDPLTGTPQALTPPDANISVGLAFNPAGTLLALGVQEGGRCIADGGFVRLWDLAQGQPQGILPRFEDGPVVMFSPKGALLAASDGQTLHLWRLNPLQEVMRLLPRFGWVGSAAFSPDGHVLAYRDGETIQFKELPSDLENRPDSSVPAPLKTVEDFANYTAEQLPTLYTVNTAGGVNQATIRLEQRNKQPGLALTYTITQPLPNDYVLVERCFSPEQDWRDARFLELWVENDDQPKTLVVQFGEGRRCAGEPFSGEVWRTFVPLLPGEKRPVEVRLVDLPLMRADWSPLQNGQLDLDNIGYLAVGIHSNGPQAGVIYLGPMQLWP